MALCGGGGRQGCVGVGGQVGAFVQAEHVAVGRTHGGRLAIRLVANRAVEGGAVAKETRDGIVHVVDFKRQKGRVSRAALRLAARGKDKDKDKDKTKGEMMGTLDSFFILKKNKRSVPEEGNEGGDGGMGRLVGWLVHTSRRH